MKNIFIVSIIFILNFQYLKSQSNNLNIKINKSEFNKKNILNSLYKGNYNTINMNISWKPYIGECALLSDDGFCYTYLDSIYKYKSVNKNYALVVFNTLQYLEGVLQDCAGCQPSQLGMALFEEDLEMWTLKSFNRSIDNIGISGFLPKCSIIQLGEASYGALFNIEEHQVSDKNNIGYLFSIDSVTFSKEIISFIQNKVIDYDEQPIIQEGSIEVIKNNSDHYDFNIIYNTIKYKEDEFKILSYKVIRYKYFDEGLKWFEFNF